MRERRGNGMYFWELFARELFPLALLVSDARTLTWRHILYDSECVAKEKKTGKNRAIILTDAVQEKFPEIYTLTGEPDMDSLMFLNPRPGSSLTLSSRVSQKYIPSM